MSSRVSRRNFLKSSAATGLVLASPLAMPSLSRAASRPQITHGLQSGDVNANSGMIWARSDRPAKMLVEIDTTGSFETPRRLAPINALPETDFAAKRLLESLPSDQEIFYRFTAADREDHSSASYRGGG